MSTQLTAYQHVRDPAAFIDSMGKAIAQSKMFNCENEAQGKVFALACIANRCDPLSIPQSYHLMHGKLSLRADAMLGRLSKAGGRYEIRERNSEVAEIHVEYKGRSLTERLTWEEAQQEPFVYQGKPAETLKHLLSGEREKLKLSTNYATPRRRGQHLWARVVSDSVRAVAPELVTGVYSPEETQQFLADDGKTASADVDDAEDAVFVASSPVSALDMGDGQPNLSDNPELAAKPATSELPKAHGQQIRRITELFTALQIPGDVQLAALKKRGATDMGDLSPEGATDLIGALESRLAKENDDLAGQSKADPAATVVKNTSPVDQVMVNEMRSLLEQASQWTGGADLGSRVRKKLQDSGLKGLSDLSVADAEVMKQAIAAKNLELFFTANIEGHQKAQEGNG